MSALEALAIVGVGLVAGTINTIVGSGSLITFPTLLAFGFSPIVANVSNTVGLAPGSLSGAIAYRRELAGPTATAARPGHGVDLGRDHRSGAAAGSARERLSPRRPGPDPGGLRASWPSNHACRGAWPTGRTRRATAVSPLFLAVYLTGVYGGYFGAAQGVILVSLLGIFLDDQLQRLNAAKNVLALLVNATSAIVFICVTHIAWEAALLIAAGSIVGGQIGGILGRRFPAPLLRVLIIVVGVTAAVVLLA